MTQEHPITPPPELIYEWAEDRELLRDPLPLPEYISNCAAQWGADKELEACCEFLHLVGDLEQQLRAARRPKPPSLKEQSEENERRLKACLEQIRNLTHADFVKLMSEEWIEDYRRQFS
jgi:hypothetical protein